MDTKREREREIKVDTPGDSLSLHGEIDLDGQGDKHTD